METQVMLCAGRLPYFVVMAKSPQASDQAYQVVGAFLAERGGRLKQDKTRSRHRTEGFDFLGFHVQRRGKTLLITPQKQKVHDLLRARRSWLKRHQAVSAEAVIRHRTPLLRGWALYDCHVVSKRTCQTVEHHLWRALWQWAKRRHPRKPRRGISRRYFEPGPYGATFYADSRDRRGQHIRLRLAKMSMIPMVRHVKVKGPASPDDPPWQAYWTTRRIKMGRRRWAKGSKRYQLAEAQRWQCLGCGRTLFDGQEVHLHHRIPVHAGGRDAVANRQWLHKVCHHPQHQQRVA